MGLDKKEVLNQEVSKMEIPIAILANSNILYTLNNLSPGTASLQIDRTLDLIPIIYPKALPLDQAKFYSIISRIYFSNSDINNALK